MFLVCDRIDFPPCGVTLPSILLTIRGDTVRVVRIIVVDLPGGIHITDIVRVAGVRGAHPPSTFTQNQSDNLVRFLPISD